MKKKVSPTEQVCMNAMHELVQTKMISRISVQDVLNATGISKATFYRHYSDKYDLYEKMLQRDVRHIFNDSCDLARWDERICDFLHHIKQEEKLYSHMVRSDPNGFCTFYTNVMSGLFLLRLERLWGKQYHLSQPLQTRCLFMSAGMAAVLADWIASGCDVAPDLLAGQFVAMFSALGQNNELNASFDAARQ
ncbi:MAG: TetR/AcrR family transcriptional regulator C-terminal domain-containing protein [Faecalibacterium sp.]|nr:TetR/AcrR family transcriptional regulator C-terminal domain-containing protein [Faecalibacterium sp.]